MVSFIAIALAMLGLLLPFWGFVVIAIAVAITRGNWGLAIVLASLADIIFGAPTGFLKPLAIPFTLVAILALTLRHFFTKNMRDEAPHSL